MAPDPAAGLGAGLWPLTPTGAPLSSFGQHQKNRSDTVAEAVWSVRGGCVSLWGCPKPSLEANPGSGMLEESCGSLAFKCSVDFSTFRSSHNWRSPGPTGGLKGTQRQSLTNVCGWVGHGGVPYVLFSALVRAQDTPVTSPHGMRAEEGPSRIFGKRANPTFHRGPRSALAQNKKRRKEKLPKRPGIDP